MNDIYSVFADAYQKQTTSTSKTPSLFSSTSDIESGMKNLKNAGKLANAYNNVKNKLTGD